MLSRANFGRPESAVFQSSEALRPIEATEPGPAGRGKCRPMTGETLSHYRVLERLGEGATSVVYKAEDLALGRPVALKLLPPGLAVDYGAIARFHHEARTASSLSHPNICTIYEIGEHQGRQFIAMEFLEGQVLSKLISGRPIESYRLLE